MLANGYIIFLTLILDLCAAVIRYRTGEWSSPAKFFLDGAGTNLTVTFDTVNADYVSLYAQATAVAYATVVGGVSTVVLAAEAGVNIYWHTAAITKTKPTADSCTIACGVDSEQSYVEGYAYEATTSSSNCDTTAKKSTIMAAVEECASALNAAGAVCDCPIMTHGGFWEGHLRWTARASVYPATTVNCRGE